jgi:hypothetical protein
MSSLTTNHASRVTSAHRVQLVAEAVVSAYIHEISPTEPPRERDRARQSCTRSSPGDSTIARSPLAARRRSRALAPERRTRLELGARA